MTTQREMERAENEYHHAVMEALRDQMLTERQRNAAALEHIRKGQAIPIVTRPPHNDTGTLEDRREQAKSDLERVDGQLIRRGLRSLLVTTVLAAAIGTGIWLYAIGRPIEAGAVIWLGVVLFALMAWRVLSTGRHWE